MKYVYLFWSFIVQTFIVHFQRAAEKTPKPSGRLRPLSFAILFGLATAGLVLGATIARPHSLLAYSASAQEEPDPVLSGVVGGSGALIWEEVTGELVTELPPGAAVTVYMRSDDDRWLFVESEQLLAGWAPSDAIIIVRSNRLPSEKVTIDPVMPAPDPSTDPQSSAVDPSQTITSTASISDATTSALTATVIVEDSRLNVRSGAGSRHPVVAKALPGERYVVLGKSDDGKWIEIELSAAGNDKAETGWVSADYVSLGNSVSSTGVSSTGVSSTGVSSNDASSTMKSAAKEANVAMPQKVGGETASQSKSPTLSARPAGLSGKLVFQNRGGDGIYLYEMGSGSLSLLTTGIDPALSPDGSQIAFTRSNNNNGVYIINADGSNERQIFGERDWLRSPKWSPDGNRIVFVRGDELTDCYVLSDGRCMEIEWINANKPGLNLDDLRKTKERQFHLARIDADGSNYQDLVALATAKAPDWSSNGIVYQSRAGIQITQDRRDADTELVYFDILKQYHHDPDWQTDGGQIIFDQREASHWEIYTINPDGSGRRALTRPEFTLVEELPSNVTPAWSPDGQQIVFLSNREPDHEAGEWRIWVMNSDGSNQRPLPIDVPIEYGFDDAQMVDWGP